ncbi:MAG: hypothetical protein QHH07_09760 [Sedimentisphaerales bacterium]|jgi:hypothetical protein|nr:hypothetical protein [Sedimentisphaerales bacterium]
MPSYRFLLVAILVALSGCRQVVQPGAELADLGSIKQAFQRQSDAAVPFRANGQCRFGIVEGPRKTWRLSLPVNLFVNPPYELYMQGQAGIGPGGLVFLGCDQRQYWLGIRPQLNTFWWGNWAEGPDGRLPLDPGVILEALGLLSIGEDPNRIAVSRRSGRVVVSWFDMEARPAKRVLLEPRTGRVRRIEYLDPSGRQELVVELARYERLTEAFFVPSRISLVSYDQGRVRCWARLNLNSIMHRRYPEEFRQRYFRMPEPHGFERVIQITEGMANDP